MKNQLDVHSFERQAERTATEHYRALQGEVLGTVRYKLSARRMAMDESDLEEAYCQAWHAVYEMIKRGSEISNLTGMLVEITWRRAVDFYREMRPGQRRELELDLPSEELDVAEQLDDRIKLQRFFTRLRGRLNPRECRAVSLCVIHGYPRAEAAELMGLKRSQMEKLMDGAMKKIGGVIAGISARGCGDEEWTRLIKSFALGLLAEEDRDHPRVSAHVAQCEACRRYVDGLRGLAAVLPPFSAPLGPVGIQGHEAGFFAHLVRLLRGGHLGGAVQALRSTGAGGAGGGSLAGSLSAGTLAKGVAVVVAGAAAAVLASHGGKPQHHIAGRHAPAAQVQSHTATRAQASLAAPATAAALGKPVGSRAGNQAPQGGASTAPSKLSSAAREAHAVATEFGIEHSRRVAPASSTGSAPAVAQPPSAQTEPAAQRVPQARSQAASVRREFAFER